MKKNRILVIYNLPNHMDKLKIKLGNIKKSEYVFVSFNNTKEELDNKGINCKTGRDYISNKEYKSIYKKAIKYLKSIANAKIDREKNFKEFLQYENTSLWWFVEFNFYRYSVKETIMSIELLQRIVDIEKPSNILTFDDKSVLTKVIALIGKKEGIPIKFIRPKIFFRINVFMISFLDTIRIYAGNLFVIVRSYIRKIWSEIILPAKLPRYDSDDSKKNNILLASMGREHESDTGKLRDVHLETIMNKLKQMNENVIFLYNIPTALIGISRLYRKITQYKEINIRPWDYYLDKKICKLLAKKKRRMKRKWQDLKDSKYFKESLEYEGLDLFSILKKKFKQMFLFEFLQSIKAIELSKKIIKKEDIDAIILACENCSPYNRSLVVAGNLLGIPVLAIQHGLISPEGDSIVDYGWTVEELRDGSKYSILPDKICVYGNYTKKSLLKLLYPENHIVIMGQPRYDSLVNPEFNREQIIRELGIDPYRKIILLLTQAFPEIERREMLFNMVAKAMEKLRQEQFIVKIHPAENKKFYREKSKRFGMDIKILEGDFDVHKVMYIADVIIGMSSTAIIEATILDKPVIVVNPPKEEISPYAKSTAVINVSNHEEILQSIKNILYNEEIRKKLAIARKSFVYQHAYKQDGKASKRVADLIMKMIKESKMEK